MIASHPFSPRSVHTPRPTPPTPQLHADSSTELGECTPFKKKITNEPTKDPTKE